MDTIKNDKNGFTLAQLTKSTNKRIQNRMMSIDIGTSGHFL